MPADDYEALLQRLAASHVPYTVLWELTHGCNLRCAMCYNVRRRQAELSTAEGLRLLEELAAAGTLRLTLTGGEILTRPDFFVLAQRARALGFALDLKTNGTLITPQLADGLAGLAPVQVEMSLLGARAATVDAAMGGRDVLSRVLRGVGLLRERGVRVVLNTLLMDLNFGERQEMVDLARALGAEYRQVCKVSPADDGGAGAVPHQLGPEQMLALLRENPQPFAARATCPEARTCHVGLSACAIDPYGTVYPCVELRLPAGDLRRQSFLEIWNGAPLFQELRARHMLGNLPDCRECGLAGYCEGRCAGLAWKERGDLYRAHTLACRHAQARYIQQHPGVPVPAAACAGTGPAIPTA